MSPLLIGSIFLNVLLFLSLAGHWVRIRDLEQEIHQMQLDEEARVGKTVLNATLSQRN